MEKITIAVNNEPIELVLEKIIVADKVINEAIALDIESKNWHDKALKERKQGKTLKVARWIIPIVTLIMSFEEIISGLILTLVVGFILWFPKNGLDSYLKRATEYENKSIEIYNSVDLLLQKHSEELNTIPQKYWCPRATKFIIEVIKNGRATTLAEAYDKLEEQIHRWNLEDAARENYRIQCEQVESLRKIERNTRSRW